VSYLKNLGHSEEVSEIETGSRVKDPAETIKSIKPYFERVGIHAMEKVEPRSTYDLPIFRVNPKSHNFKCHREILESRLMMRAPASRRAYGKGWSVNQSKASGIMEAVERYSAQMFSHSTTIKKKDSKATDDIVSASSLKFPSSVPPKCVSCLYRNVYCFSDASKLDEQVRGYSLVNEKSMLVPAATVFYPYACRGKSFMFNDTGGLASGNTFGEAILSGVAEVIERDALYHAYNLGLLPEMQLVASDDGCRTEIREYFERMIPEEKVLSFSIKNPSLDLGVTTVSSFVLEKDFKSFFIFGGSGAHLDPQVSMIRALTELIQQKIRKGYLNEIPLSSYMEFDVERQVSAKNIGSLHDYSSKKISEEVDRYVSLLGREGLDIIVVDLTHPKLSIPVVRVIIPGLVSYGSPFKISVLSRIREKFGSKN